MTIQVIQQKEHPYPDYTGQSIMDLALPPAKIWVPQQRIVVLGNSQDASQELRAENVLADQIPVIRRIAGGGAVVLDSSVVCYALRLKKSSHLQIGDYFRLGVSLAQELLRKHYQLKTQSLGISDLCIDDRKILGCSLYIPKHYALFLGSLLIHDHRAVMDRYLAFPSRQPDYRQGRSHGDFTTHLQEQTFKPVDGEIVTQQLGIILNKAPWPDLLF